MLTKVNPFAFASSSNSDPLSVSDTSAALPQTFSWEGLLVNLAVEIPADRVAAAIAAALPPAEEVVAPVVEAIASVEPPISLADVAVALTMAASPTPIAPVAVVAPAPALVQIAEPPAQPAPSLTFLPTGPAQDTAYDAYANLFRGIEDRDLLAELQGSLSTDSPWQGAFGPPLG